MGVGKHWQLYELKILQVTQDRSRSFKIIRWVACMTACKLLRHCVSKKNKNLAIANRSRVSSAHNTSRASVTLWP